MKVVAAVAFDVAFDVIVVVDPMSLKLVNVSVNERNIRAYLNFQFRKSRQC